jgi:legumain
MYDDVAGDVDNPFPEQLFNKPTPKGTPGIDVYSGCKIDYKRTHHLVLSLRATPHGFCCAERSVTAANFINVLTGTGTTGKVLRSTKDDNVFVYYTGISWDLLSWQCADAIAQLTNLTLVCWADHGGSGIVAFPFGPALTATKLNNGIAVLRYWIISIRYRNHVDFYYAALQLMFRKGMYKRLVFYLEACESGSMFQVRDTMRHLATPYATMRHYATLCNAFTQPLLGCLR